MNCSVSPDGKLVATTSDQDNVVRFWDMATGNQVGEFRGHLGSVTSMAFSPDSKRLATGGSDSTVLIIDVQKVVGKR